MTTVPKEMPVSDRGVRRVEGFSLALNAGVLLSMLVLLFKGGEWSGRIAEQQKHTDSRIVALADTVATTNSSVASLTALVGQESVSRARLEERVAELRERVRSIEQARSQGAHP